MLYAIAAVCTLFAIVTYACCIVSGRCAAAEEQTLGVRRS